MILRSLILAALFAACAACGGEEDIAPAACHAALLGPGSATGAGYMDANIALDRAELIAADCANELAGSESALIGGPSFDIGFDAELLRWANGGSGTPSQ